MSVRLTAALQIALILALPTSSRLAAAAPTATSPDTAVQTVTNGEWSGTVVKPAGQMATGPLLEVPPPAPAGGPRDHVLRPTGLVEDRIFIPPTQFAETGEPLQPQLPRSAIVVRNTPLTPPLVSSVAEPNVGTQNDGVFMAHNWYAEVSTNNGATFSYISPYQQFPYSPAAFAAGFCCDQRVAQDPARDLIFWMLMYAPTGATPTSTNGLRLAVAHGQASLAANTWQYHDFTPADFGLPPGKFFDYPQMQISANYLYFTANVFDTVTENFAAAVIGRLPLNSLNANTTFTMNTYVTTTFASTAPVDGATSTMYFGAINSTSTMVVVRWPETQSTPTATGVSGLSSTTVALFNCPTPDQLNPCGRGDNRIQTGWVTGSELGFMWASAQNGGSRPYPYTRVAILNPSTLAVISQPDIFSTSSAFLYPAVAINARGHLGGTIDRLGGNVYTSLGAIIRDEFSPDVNTSGWELIPIAEGNRGTSSRWGDYNGVVAHERYPNTWVGAGHVQIGTSANSGSSLRNFWFMRERDVPCTAAPAVPTPMSPSGGISITTPAYTWAAAPGATSYELEIDNGSNPVFHQAYDAANVCEVITAGSCSVGPWNVPSPPPLLVGTDYSWKVLAQNICGTSAYSTSLSVAVSAVSATTAIQPSGTILSTTPTYSWNKVSGAASYQLWIDTVSGGAHIFDAVYLPDVCPASGSICSVGPANGSAPPALTRGESYRWWVRTTDARAVAISSSPLVFSVGYPVTGRVTSAETSEGLAGIQVRFYAFSFGTLDTFASPQLQASAWTDESGNYTAGLLPGTFGAATYATQGYVNKIYNDVPCSVSCDARRSATPIVVSPAGMSDIDFVLTRGGRIAGRVINIMTSSALANVQVDIYNTTGQYITSGLSDASGNYISDGGLLTGNYVAATRNTLGFIDLAYNAIPSLGWNPASIGLPIPVTTGQTTGDINFVLRLGGTITGRVTSSIGAPLADVTVAIFDSDAALVDRARTNAQGQYTSTVGFPTGIYFALTTNDAGYVNQIYKGVTCIWSCSLATPIGVEAGWTTTEINFSLSLGGQIAGVVTNAATGGGLAGVTVAVYDSIGQGRLVARTDTDITGAFVTPGLPPGIYYARTTNALGFIDKLYDNVDCLTCRPTAGTPIQVTVGAKAGNIGFALSPGGRISGKVTDAVTGAAVGLTSISIYDSTGQFLFNVGNDSSGNYTTTTGLPTGTYFARTHSGVQGYIDVLYDNIPCISFSTCTVVDGTPIPVTAPDPAANIDFRLPVPGVPTISSISPDSVAIGEGANVTVNGTNFVLWSVVLLDDVPLSSYLVSTTQLIAAVTAADAARKGTRTIKVRTSAPGGGVSNAVTLTVAGAVERVTLSADKIAPQPSGTTITWTATATGGVAPLEYQWWVFDGRTWTIARAWGVANTFAWTPGMQNSSYQVGVWARGRNGSAPEAMAATPFPITRTVVTAVSLAADRTAPQPARTTSTWTATASGGEAPLQYRWWIFDGATWNIVRDWATGNTFAWTPAVANADYQVGVWVRGNRGEAPEAFAAAPFAITPPTTVTAVALAADRTAPQPAGTTIAWTATATGGVAPIEYKWWVFDGATWSVARDWTDDNRFAWMPAVANPSYQVGVWARGHGASAPEAFAAAPFAITGSTTVVSAALGADRTAPQPAGTTITWTALAVGGAAPLEYRWWVYDGVTWSVARDWAVGNVFSWTPDVANANYQVGIWVRSHGGSVAEAFAAAPFAIQPSGVTAAATSIGFNGLTVDGTGVVAYSESGFTVGTMPGGWVDSTSYGNPSPYILFSAPGGTTITGEVRVTAGGAQFGFSSVDLYSGTTTIPYTITGFRNSVAAFTVTGTVPNTFGEFRTVLNPSPGTRIDTLVITLTNNAAPCCRNPMGLDNIVVTP